jgi:hypothetical protein
MLASLYTITRPFRLFGKREWVVAYNGRDIASFAERETALELAMAEAKRTSRLGRRTEVRINEGEGYVHYAGFEASRPENEEEPDALMEDEKFTPDTGPF